MKSSIHRFRVAKTAITSTNIIDRTSIEVSLYPEDNAQVCDRCRRLKKKCSKTPPACELCTSAGHVCSLGKAGRQDALSTVTKDVSGAAPGAVGSNSPRVPNGLQLSSPRDLDHHAHNAATASTFDGTYLSYVHAYFRHVHRAYPFLDRQEILSNAKASTYLNVWADNPDSTVSASDPASDIL
jgi:hypothetical protein